MTRVSTSCSPCFPKDPSSKWVLDPDSSQITPALTLILSPFLLHQSTKRCSTHLCTHSFVLEGVVCIYSHWEKTKQNKTKSKQTKKNPTK